MGAFFSGPPHRLPGEAFAVYRARLRADAGKVKRWLRGRWVWVSVGPLLGPDGKPMSKKERKVGGTYRKPKGHVYPHCGEANPERLDMDGCEDHACPERY